MGDERAVGLTGRVRERLGRMLYAAGETATTEDLLLIGEARKRVGRVIRARWVILGLLAGYGVFVAVLFGHPSADVGAVSATHRIVAVAAILFGAAYNGWYHYSYRWFVRFRSLNQVQILFDIVVVTVVVHYSGGAVSWFWAMYAVLTLEAALLLDRKGDTYAMAVLGAFAYGGVLTFEYYRLIPPVPMPFENNALQQTFSYEMIKWAFVLVTNLCIAFVGDYMMESVKRRQEMLRKLVVQDPLLPLYNRRYFYHRFNSEIQRAKRYGRTVSLLILDVDDFKSFNDRAGHFAGDELLRTLAELILSNIRRSDRDPGYEVDIACRYGGDEFALILPEAASFQGAAAAERLRGNIETTWAVVVAERIRRQVENIRWEGLDVTVSVGVASYPEHGIDMDGLVKAADDALYAAKRAGRNRIVVAGSVPPPAAPGGGEP
ncbi:MAG: GGDEF domain-containing protein [Gemmatimonadota bacterium]